MFAQKKKNQRSEGSVSCGDTTCCGCVSLGGVDAEPSSADLDLRLVGFEAAQSSTCCCRLGDPVAAANSFKLALTHDLHCHPYLPVVGPFSRAGRGQINRQSEHPDHEQRASPLTARGCRTWTWLFLAPSPAAPSQASVAHWQRISLWRKNEKLIPSILSTITTRETALTYEWPHHWIINLPHGFQGHPAVHVNGSCQWLKDVSHGLWHLNVFLLFLIFFRTAKLRTAAKMCSEAFSYNILDRLKAEAPVRSRDPSFYQQAGREQIFEFAPHITTSSHQHASLPRCRSALECSQAAIAASSLSTSTTCGRRRTHL